MLALAAPGASARPHEACAVLWSRLAPLAAAPGESAGSEEAAGGASELAGAARSALGESWRQLRLAGPARLLATTAASLGLPSAGEGGAGDALGSWAGSDEERWGAGGAGSADEHEGGQGGGREWGELNLTPLPWRLRAIGEVLRTEGLWAQLDSAQQGPDRPWARPAACAQVPRPAPACAAAPARAPRVTSQRGRYGCSLRSG
jgi:hypothetical protein